MTVKTNSVFQLRFKLLESENTIREMESRIDFSKEQILLMREAIKEKQDSVDRLRSRLERFVNREANYERI
jgi:hypothetical protein